MDRMFERLNERLTAVKEQGRNMRKWESRLAQLQEELGELRHTRDQARRRLAAEEKDVERLSGVSLSGFIYSILGKKLEKLDEEQREALEAKIRYDHAERAVQNVQEQIDQLEFKLNEVRRWELDYKQIFQEKERVILDSNKELRDLADRLADLSVQGRELEEALNAGGRVQKDLGKAEAKLSAARGWGTYDMLGGGMISTHIKHNYIDDAMDLIYTAENSMQRFEKELRDVGDTVSTDLNMDGLLVFTDYFFDNFITDWFVQGRINEMMEQVSSRRATVDKIIDRLAASNCQVKQEYGSLHRQYVQMVETYR